MTNFQVQDYRSGTLGKRPVATDLLLGQTAINYNDGSPGVFIRTSENKLVKLGPTNVSASSPTVPEDLSDICPGEMWLNTTNSVLYVWSGLSWIGVSEVGFPPATASTLGAVIVGSGLEVTSTGLLSLAPGGILPATTSVLGGVIVGSGLSVTSDGTLSASAQALTPATASVLGGIKVGSGLSVTSDGTLSTPVLSAATASVLGGIKVGSGLSVTSDGTLSASSSTGTVTAVTAGTGLETTPSVGITSTGSVALANTAVTAGVYTNTNITVDAQGRITAAANGVAGGGVTFKGTTDVTGTAPSAVSGDMYLNTVAGTVAASWTGIAGDTASVNQFVVYNSSNQWELGGIINNNNVVTLTTTQTVTGAKTFNALTTVAGITITGTVTADFDDGTF